MPDNIFTFTGKFKEAFENGLAYEMKMMKKPNILIIGRTGVGKSALINAVFGKNVARVGTGEPETMHYVRFESETSAVVIIDSKGWEGGASKESEFYKSTADLLSKRVQPQDRIHMVWYAIDAPGARFTDFDAKITRELFRGIPVIFVLTKGDIASVKQVKALTDAIAKAKIPNCVGVIPVCAEPEELMGGTKGKVFGLDTLVEKTLQMLPDLVKKAFIAAQIIHLKMKANAAKKRVGLFALGAGVFGAVPKGIPDAPVLASAQAVMAAKLAAIYGFNTKSLTAFGVALGGALGTLWAGKTAVDYARNLLGPVLGTVTLGVIDGTISAAMTWAMGIALTGLFHEAVTMMIQDDEFAVTPEWAQRIFNEKLAAVREWLKSSGLVRFLLEVKSKEWV